jgi:hypothetical protein
MSDEIKIPDAVLRDAACIAEGESDGAAWEFIARWMREECAKVAEDRVRCHESLHDNCHSCTARLCGQEIASEIRELGTK